jgi:hypothetical protein
VAFCSVPQSRGSRHRPAGTSQHTPILEATKRLDIKTIHGGAEKSDGIGCQKVGRNRVSHQDPAPVGAGDDHTLAGSDLGMRRQFNGHISQAERTAASAETPANDDTAGIATIDPACGNFTAGRHQATDAHPVSRAQREALRAYCGRHSHRLPCDLHSTGDCQALDRSRYLENDRYFASLQCGSPRRLNSNDLSGAQGIGVSRIAFDHYRGCRIVSNLQSVDADAAKTGNHAENARSP